MSHTADVKTARSSSSQVVGDKARGHATYRVTFLYPAL